MDAWRLWFSVVLSLAAGQYAAAAEPAVDFNRDIRPILSENCFHCHGPDEGTREAGLRLDTVDGLKHEADGRRAVVAGEPDKSELIRRLISSDPDDKMPPPKSGKTLTARQIDLVRRWIQEGAAWKLHWSFVPPQRPALPDVKSAAWVKTPIDQFVLAKLERAGAKPSPAAARHTLLRRLTFDLTGLPPTSEDAQAFVADGSDAAYERAVDRLLASPRFGERMAYRWLEAARFADTSGYQSDGYREMWRWRDWVIEALNKNMPFDQFTIEQLAGDMLQNPTLDQRIATAFNRNHRANSEGGIVPEEFQVEYVVDRVDTTMTVWQGLTFGCARCHSHKYDPLSQTDYYRAYAFFNNIPEFGRAIKEGPSPPFIQAPTREQQVELASRESQLLRTRQRVGELTKRLPEELGKWEASRREPLPGTAAPLCESDGLVVHLKLDGNLKNTPAQAEGEIQRSATTVPTAGARTDALPTYEPKFADEGSKPSAFVTGRLDQAAQFDGERFVDAGSIGKLGYFERFSFAAWIRQPEHAAGSILSKMEHIEQGSGYCFDVTKTGAVQLNMVKRWLDDSLRVETVEPIPTGRWVHVCVTYDGSRAAKGIQFYFDGRPVALKANLDFINQSFDVLEPLRIGSGSARFKGEIDDVRIYRRWLSEADVRVLAEPATVAEILRGSETKRSESEQHKLRQFFIEVAAPAEFRDAWRDLQQLEREHVRFLATLPTVMVMDELQQPRATHVLLRGQYDRPGERVQPGVPTSLPPLPRDAAANRLALAKWLVSRENPLTARVIVNRFWRDLFGVGLVKTTEDFGSQGEAPSHPELLDWLAVEFMEGTHAGADGNTASPWDVKRLLKLIVMSNTYRQSSEVAPMNAALPADPENRLLSRGPRHRLTGEMVRDQALFVSGLLTEKQGGPSVKPYQPDGLWAELATDTLYEQAHGPDLYRRSLYVYWKRTVPFPMLMNFDSSGREMCEVRQSRTNTPLQALNLLNDVTFVEAARGLAQRLLSTEGTDESRLRRAYWLVVSREPTARESELLLKSLARYRASYAANLKRAEALLKTGEAAPLTSVPPAELAAWTTLSSTLLNLDETVTKE